MFGSRNEPDDQATTPSYGGVGSNLPLPSSPTNNQTAPAIDGGAPTIGQNSDLLQVKKQALDSLAPLVDRLDQHPADKFKTLMMMIQATDNQTLIPDAFNAAKQISDEAARAQALLDVVNEINYFTQKKS